LEKIDRPWGPERYAFSILDVEVHGLAGKRITTMGEYLDNNMMKTISLSKFEGCGASTEEGLESIDVELLNDTRVVVTADDIILVMLEYFVRAFVRSRKLGWEEILLRTAGIEEDEVSRLVDVLCGRVCGRNTLEFIAITTLLGSRPERLKVVVQERNIFIRAGECVCGLW